MIPETTARCRLKITQLLLLLVTISTTHGHQLGLVCPMLMGQGEIGKVVGAELESPPFPP